MITYAGARSVEGGPGGGRKAWALQQKLRHERGMFIVEVVVALRLGRAEVLRVRVF